MFGFQLTFRQCLWLSELREVLPMLIVQMLAISALLAASTFIIWHYGPIAAVILCGISLLGVFGVYASILWNSFRSRHQVPAARQPSSEIASLQDAFSIEEIWDGLGVGEAVDDGEPAHQVGVLNEV